MLSNNSFRSGQSCAVSPSLVHKRDASAVLVTAVDTGEDGWTIRARLPAHHTFHNDATGRQAGYHDPLHILEAFRQGCIAIGHLTYAVPPEAHFLVRRYELSVLDWRALHYRPEPAALDLRTEVCREFRARGDGPVHGVELAATAMRNGAAAVEMSVSFGWLSDESWQRMRSGSRWEAGPQPVAADPATVGRERPENVVIGPPLHRVGDGSVCAPVVVDTGNPTFFDHPLDHLPAALILEASRQLARAALGPRSSAVLGPSWLRCEFRSFAELSPACAVTLAPASGTSAFRATVSQSGQQRAVVELGFAAPEPPQ